MRVIIFETFFMPWIKDIQHLRREMFDYGPTGWVKTSCRKGSFIARPHSTVLEYSKQHATKMWMKFQCFWAMYSCLVLRFRCQYKGKIILFFINELLSSPSWKKFAKKVDWLVMFTPTHSYDSSNWIQLLFSNRFGCLWIFSEIFFKERWKSRLYSHAAMLWYHEITDAKIIFHRHCERWISSGCIHRRL